MSETLSNRIRKHLNLDENHEAGLIPFGTQVFLADLADKIDANKQPYLVWSNEHGMWWRSDRAGYTEHIEDAGVYTRGHAVQIAQNALAGYEIGTPPPEMAVAVADLPPRLQDLLRGRCGQTEDMFGG